MLDSNLLGSLAHRLSWLFIETPARAIGFLSVAITALILGAVLELSQSWNLYAAGAMKSGNNYQLVLQSIGTEFDKTGGDIVVLLGGSTIRELTADDTFLSKEFTVRCGRDIQFVNLGSSSQSFVESWDIAALVPASRKRLFLVGINPYRLSFDDDEVIAELSHNRTGVPTSFSLLWTVALSTGHLGSLERVIGSVARQVSLGAHWQLRDLIIARSSVASPPSDDPYQPDRSGYREPVWTRAEKLRQADEYIATRVADFHDRFRMSVEWFNRFFDHFQGPNSDVKFVITPTDETFGKADKLISDAFRDALQLLGGERRILDLRNQVSDLSSNDFFDVQHLVAKGRAKLQPIFVDNVSRVLGCASHASE
jgi:hypothetical protein